MLLKSRISKIEIHSDEWFEKKLGKLSSSEIHFIAGSSFWTTGCQTYIYRKVGERVTNKSAVSSDYDQSSMVSAMRWGNEYELEAVRRFAKFKELPFIVYQKLILEETGMFGSTPDGLIINKESSDRLEYDVSTIEVKCPPTYHNYIRLALCKTPQDIKRESAQYYWQVLDQMLICQSMYGYFIVYHPDFKQGNMNVVEFRKMQKVDGAYPLVEDLKFLAIRKQMAIDKFNEVMNEVVLLGVH